MTSYHPGQLNKAADALSRMPAIVELSQITVPFIIDKFQIQAEVAEDEELQKVIEALEIDPDTHPNFHLHQGQLHYKNRIVISSKSSIIPTILHTFHDSIMGGHSGFLRTYK